ncbi:MAG: Hsp20/alpha crystallin family protein [Actinomycetota bacterium]
MAIIRWDPLRDIWSMKDDMDRMLQTPLWFNRAVTERDWAPACDIHETSNEIVVDCELAGIDPDDVDVSIQGDTMTIRGERLMSEDVKEKDYHRIERSYGTFVRVLQLPADVVYDKATASFDNGLLRVTVPKMAIVKPKAKKLHIAQKSKKQQKVLTQ